MFSGRCNKRSVRNSKKGQIIQILLYTLANQTHNVQCLPLGLLAHGPTGRSQISRDLAALLTVT